jgi:hypothetical protein
VLHGQRNGSLRPLISVSIPVPLFFLSGSFSLIPTRLRGPRSRPYTSQKFPVALVIEPGTSGYIAMNYDLVSFNILSHSVFITFLSCFIAPSHSFSFQFLFCRFLLFHFFFVFLISLPYRLLNLPFCTIHAFPYNDLYLGRY